MNGDAPAFMQFSVRLKKNRFTVSGSTVHGWKRMKRSKGTPLGGSEGRCCFVALTSGDVLKFQTFFWGYLLFPFQNANGIIFSSVIS